MGGVGHRVAASGRQPDGPTPPPPPPPPVVWVGVVVEVGVVTVGVVVDVGVVEVVVVVVGVVEVVGVVVDVVEVAVVVGVVVDVVEVVEVVELVDVEPPLSEAMTASATPRPMTTATSSAIAAFIPVLMPPSPGGSSSGSLMTRVGSSCMGARY